MTGDRSFDKRASVGSHGQAELTFMLAHHGFDVMLTGQENWLSASTPRCASSMTA